MGLNSKYFDYCGELGLMQENYTFEDALDTLVSAIKKEKNVDPGFIEELEKLTVYSDEIDPRVVVLYKYNVDLKYLQMGEWHTGTVSNVTTGKNGAPDSLHVLEFKGDGNYKVIRSAAEVPYSSWNDNNLFTLDEMKNALKGSVEDYLPARTARYESTSWNVDAYFVPIFSVDVTYKGKEYNLYYNLHNGYYHYEWATNPAIRNKAKKEKTFTTVFKIVSIILSIIGFLSSIGSSAGTTVPCAILTAIQIFVLIKVKKDLDFYEEKHEDNPNRNPIVGAILNSLLFIILAFVSLIFGLAG